MARYVVTVSEDTSDGDLGAGDLSLREAIELSNARSGRDTVVFAGDVREITLAGALPTITDDLVLRGGGAVTIDAAAEDESVERRVLDISGAQSVTIAGLRLTGGHVSGEAATGSGGAIRATDVASLAIVNSSVVQSSATTGGGIAALGTTVLTVTNSVVSNNRAVEALDLSSEYAYVPGCGGGIYGSRDVVISGSRISHNEALAEIYLGLGGGVFSGGGLTLLQSSLKGNTSDKGGGVFAAGSASVTNSVVAGNTALKGKGGGIWADTAVVTESAIRGNRVSAETGLYTNRYGAQGGGIYAYTAEVVRSEISSNGAIGGGTAWGGGIAGGTVTLRSSTIANNFSASVASSSGGGIRGEVVRLFGTTVTGNVVTETYGYANGDVGAGVLGNTVTLHDSLVLGNSDGNAASDISGTLRVDARSIIGGDGRQVFADTRQLAPGVFAGVLGLNGGPTATAAILPGGLADGAADPATATATDQRGVARDGAPDLGAFELHGRPLVLVGGPGADVLLGRDADDRIRGADGDDALSGLAGDDQLFGGAGRDSLLGGGGDDRLDGGAGRDQLDGGAGDDTLSGHTGRDALSGGDGRDSLAGGWGDDSLAGGVQRDDLRGEAGADRLDGGGSADLLFGGGGRDRLSGGAGEDDLSGGPGADILDGGSGDDQMAGGAGNDIYRITEVGDTVVEQGGKGFDVVELKTYDRYVLPTAVEGLKVLTSGSIEAFGNPGDNVMRASNAGDTLQGLGGDDRILGGSDRDDLRGGKGDDALVGKAGDDRLGGAADDDMLRGGANADTLSGGDGKDTLQGDGGRDVLFGGAGADLLTGGSGADTFRFLSTAEIGLGPTSDTVTNFEARDTIDLNAIDADTTLAGHQAFRFVGDAAFAGSAGELRFAANVLAGDTDGDGAANFTLSLPGAADGLFD